MPHHARVRHAEPQRSEDIIAKMTKDIHALNASVLIISQKMRYLVRNEKILGRNLIVLNRKLKALESGGTTAGITSGAGADPNAIMGEISRISPETSKNSEALSGLQSEMEEMRKKCATAESVRELKCVLDSINPLEFVTMKDVDERIEGALKRKAKK